MEEWCNMECGGQLEQTYQILIKQSDDKMPFEGIEVAKVLARIPLFTRYFNINSEQFINLCIAQDAIEIQKGSEVYSLEDTQHRYVYVILQGQITLPGAVFGPLSTVGHLEVLHKVNHRMQQPAASTTVKVMRIKEGSLMRLFKHQAELRKNRKFIEVNSYFKILTELERLELALRMEGHRFMEGQVLKASEEAMKDVLFFIHGRAEVLARLKDDKQFSIDRLEEFASYGEYQCVNGEETAWEVRGVGDGALFRVSYEQLVGLQHGLLEVFKDRALPYPPVQELCFLEGVRSRMRKEEQRVRGRLGLGKP